MGAGSIQGAVDDLENEVLALRRRCEAVQMSIEDLIDCPDVRDDQHGPCGRSDEPGIITHSHFDASISHWFPAIDQISNDRLVLTLNKSRQTAAMGLLPSLYELFFRLGGVSAFPLQPKDDTQLLGIRFEQYDPSEFVFMKPHYLILSRQESTPKTGGCNPPLDSDLVSDLAARIYETPPRWTVYKHTLPSCILHEEMLVALKLLMTDNTMRQLVAAIRDALLRPSEFDHQVAGH